MRRRGELRASIANTEELQSVQLELIMITRMLRKARNKQWEESRSNIVEEMWEAWRARIMAEVHTLRVKLAANGKRQKSGTTQQGRPR